MRCIAIAVLAVDLSGCYVSVNITRAEVAAEPVIGCVTDAECEALGDEEAQSSAYLTEA